MDRRRYDGDDDVRQKTTKTAKFSGNSKKGIIGNNSASWKGIKIMNDGGGKKGEDNLEKVSDKMTWNYEFK